MPASWRRWITGVEEANVWGAFVLTMVYLIASTGPPPAGRLRDLRDDFRPGIWLCVGVATVMRLLTPFPRHTLIEI